MTQPPDPPDAAAEWRAAQGRVSALVRAAEPEHLALPVPACPDWSVRELLAHMIGLDRDVLAGNEPDDHDASWTQTHVDARRELDVDTLLAEWDGLADDLAAHLREDPRALGDAIIHEQDLRGALGRPGARDTDGLASIREQMAERLGDTLADLGAPVLELRGPDWRWRSGEGDPDVVLQADGFDLARALTSRRTAEQLRSWTTSGDVGPWLKAFEVLGPLPEQELPE